MARYSIESKRDEHIFSVISRLTHRELQKAVVARGMPFDDVVNKDHHGLVSFFYQNFDSSEDPNLLNEYDIWLEGQLIARGYKKGDAMLHPSLRLGYTQGIENSQSISSRPSPMKLEGTKEGGIGNAEPKPVKHQKAEKDPTTGVRSGTKKSLTYQLAMQGIPMNEVIEQVMNTFPDAQDKSIKIWYKRALQETK